MKQGNWVPLSKALVRKLPTTREYSEVEAMFSISVDYDCDNKASIAGYASLWGWSRKRVCNFLKKYGLEIKYKDKFNRHKKGQVALQEGNRKGTGGEQVEFINSKCLSLQGNRKGTGREQEGNRKGSTTKEPNPNPNPIKYIVEEKNKPYLPSAEKLKSIALLRRNQNITDKDISSWSNTIRLMIERDKVEFQEITSALDWYEDHWNDNQFMPVIESAGSLREKWGKLVAAIKRSSCQPKNGFIEPSKTKNYREGL